jgi:Protein of unknown function (DUF2924)
MAQLHDELDRIVSLPTHQLRIEWRRHFRGEPPRGLSRDLLLRAVTYKMQERVHGGLIQADKRALRDLAAKIAGEGADGALHLSPILKPGQRLVREWRGQTHSVLVLENGFEYQDRRYRTLSEIARQITGAHWSGPRFFGLVRARKSVATATVRRSRAHATDAVDGQP